MLNFGTQFEMTNIYHKKQYLTYIFCKIRKVSGENRLSFYIYAPSHKRGFNHPIPPPQKKKLWLG